MDKADSHVHQGMFFGYVWCSTECLVGSRDGIFKCRTVKRRPEANAYDSECADYLKMYYDDYIMKGANWLPQLQESSPWKRPNDCAAARRGDADWLVPDDRDLARTSPAALARRVYAKVVGAAGRPALARARACCKQQFVC